MTHDVVGLSSVSESIDRGDERFGRASHWVIRGSCLLSPVLVAPVLGTTLRGRATSAKAAPLQNFFLCLLAATLDFARCVAPTTALHSLHRAPQYRFRSATKKSIGKNCPRVSPSGLPAH